tara:strand:- start:12321 stop:12767 length:447 start_codon:yes stop_codon:yes gene_type:complete
MSNTQEVNILLVEDDVVDQQGLKRALRELRLVNPLLIANNGVTALEILRSDKDALINPPYIVLLDINMPRMNGLEFLREIRADKNLRETVVFILSTSNSPDDISLAYDLNVAGYIVKSDLKNSFLEALSMLEHYWRIVELPKKEMGAE